MADSTHTVIPFTGERMIPESAPMTTYWSHVYRYKFACTLVHGKAVLDVACGEGYGASGLRAAGAKSVLAIDVSPEACCLARSRYSLSVACGSAEELPLADGTLDVVVSFETIEHLTDPARFVSECARVLKPGGLLIISSPNRPVYRLWHSELNPYHVSELDESQFVSLLQSGFSVTQLYCQFPTRISRCSRHALMMESSPWLGLRGVWRLRQYLRKRVEHAVWQAPAANSKSDLDRLIATPARWQSSLVNPYLVHRYAGADREAPLYFVAVATSMGTNA